MLPNFKVYIAPGDLVAMQILIEQVGGNKPLCDADPTTMWTTLWVVKGLRFLSHKVLNLFPSLIPLIYPRSAITKMRIRTCLITSPLRCKCVEFYVMCYILLTHMSPLLSYLAQFSSGSSYSELPACFNAIPLRTVQYNSEAFTEHLWCVKQWVSFFKTEYMRMPVTKVEGLVKETEGQTWRRHNQFPPLPKTNSFYFVLETFLITKFIFTTIHAMCLSYVEVKTQHCTASSQTTGYTSPCVLGTQPQYSPAVWSWTSFLTSLCFGFLKMSVTTEGYYVSRRIKWVHICKALKIVLVHDILKKFWSTNPCSGDVTQEEPGWETYIWELSVCRCCQGQGAKDTFQGECKLQNEWQRGRKMDL